MAKVNYPSTLLFFFLIFLFFPYTNQLQSSHAQTLLRIQRLLNFPAVLSSWNASTDFCNTEPTSSLTVVCYERTITQLHIIGEKGSPLLPRNFSSDSFFTTLVRIPTLKVLSLVSLGLWGPLSAKISRLSSLEILNISSNFFYRPIPKEISALGNLQTLILDDNMFSGTVPNWLSALPVLTVLSLKKNSLGGPLPDTLKTLENLRVLALSRNHLYGEVPDLSSLRNLQVLDLEDNFLGPQFPILGNKLVTLVLRKNRFSSGIPSEVSSYYQLRRMDISFNRFVGPFMPSLLSLPSINYLNIAGNRLTGMLFQNTSCNAELMFVDLSSNLLTGTLPTCLLSNSKNRVVLYSRNCIATSSQDQHPNLFCRTEALAVGISPHKRKTISAVKVAILTSLVGVVGGVVLVGLLILLVVRRVKAKRVIERAPRRLMVNASTGFSSKLLSDARYLSQSMRLGALGLQPYRMFSLEELEEATNSFETSTFMGEGSHGQMYRGRLNDGSLVAIRCLKLKRRQSAQTFVNHIELISKLRHRHLVCALGHCFEYYLDDSSVSRIFLVFEYVSNGTLRRNISAVGIAGQRLTWSQRIAAAIGVVKGIQFLHTGIVPGLFENDLKITNVLLDQNLVAKISSYNLPVLAENMITEVGVGVSSSNTKKESRVPGRTKNKEKSDVYDLGVILLEIITGKPIRSQSDLNFAKDQLQASGTGDNAAEKSIVDPVLHEACLDESVKTVMDICIRCLSEEPTERPSVEDVLWHLQFGAQVQDAGSGDSQSSEGSPVVTASQPPRLRLAPQ